LRLQTKLWSLADTCMFPLRVFITKQTAITDTVSHNKSGFFTFSEEKKTSFLLTMYPAEESFRRCIVSTLQ